MYEYAEYIRDSEVGAAIALPGELESDEGPLPVLKRELNSHLNNQEK